MVSLQAVQSNLGLCHLSISSCHFWYFPLFDCFCTLRIHFVKRKKQLAEGTVYPNLIEIDIFLQLNSNRQPLTSKTNTQPFSQTGWIFLKCWSSMLDARENACNFIEHEKKAKETLDECLNWFKLSSNIFYEKNVGPTSSNIVCKRIQHFLSNMLDGVGPTCWTRFPLP